MKARVTANVFKNKATGTYHEKGEVIELTKTRFQEVRAKGFVEAASKGKQDDSENEDTDEQSGPDDEPEPSRITPAHQFEGLAYIETPVNKVQPQAKEHHER